MTELKKFRVFLPVELYYLLAMQAKEQHKTISLVLEDLVVNSMEERV